MKDTVESLPILILNPHNRCNCRCVMCDIWKRGAVQEIGRSELERHLDSIGGLGVEWVVLSGGEPLMHSDLFGICSALRERGIRITLLSNGLLLGRNAELVAEYIDDVIVSLDGPPEIHNQIRGIPRAFELLAAGIARIHALKLGFPIAARCTVQRANHGHLTAAMDTARELGLKSISFLALDLHSSAFDRQAGEISEQAGLGLERSDLVRLDSQIETLIAAGACGKFVLESPEKLRRIAGHFRCQLGLDQPVAPLCNAPWKSAVVEADGTVRPCFFHPPVGRLSAGVTLSQALNGPEAIAFRRHLDVASNPICRRCVCSLR